MPVDVVPVCSLLTLNGFKSGVSIVDSEQANATWDNDTHSVI